MTRDDPELVTMTHTPNSSPSSPEARLAAAVRHAKKMADAYHDVLGEDPVESAQWLSAADPTLAADLELAAAVRRLFDEWPDRTRSPHLFADGPGWRIITEDWDIDSGVYESLPDAVDAAIELVQMPASAPFRNHEVER